MIIAWHRILRLLVAAAAVSPSSSGEASSASFAPSPSYLFYEVPGRGGYGVSLAGSPWRQPTPILVEVVDVDGQAEWLASPYDTVSQTRGQASGRLTSPGGSVFHVEDRYSILGNGSFGMSRVVRIEFAAATETAFSSRFSLAAVDTDYSLGNQELFVPGIAYLSSRTRNGASPPSSLFGDLHAPVALVREDRLPLPLAMVRDPVTSSTLSLRHTAPDGRSFLGEDFTKRIVDDRMQFGSLGLVAARRGNTTNGNGVGEVAGLQVAFQFPGSEGDRTYICCHSGWANRSHPLRTGFSHNYSLAFTARSESASYFSAVQAEWRLAFRMTNPRPPPADQEAAYRASMDLLAIYGVEYNGVPTMPFRAALPGGEVDDTSSQMGFVGKALPAAAFVLQDAVASGNASRRAQAEAIVDVWVTNAWTTAGIPKTWYNTAPGGVLAWRADSPYMGHLRIVCEGARGALSAYRSSPKPAWLRFARQLGDFLLKVQAPDGSIAGEWAWNGTELGSFTTATDQPIPLLLDLYRVTGDGRYREAAIAAGEYSRAQMGPTFQYIGGAVDNHNVEDKEAGALAMHAFLELHNVTGDRAWVAAAAQAGTYCETWTYAWDVPLYRNDPKGVYPPTRTTLGVSLIALGQSGADNFMASTVFDYYRLYRATNDTHFLRFARFLQDATKQIMDWDNTLGYAHPGLMNEAISLVPPRGRGVDKWLPWLTVAILDPMVRLLESTGRPSLPSHSPVLG